MWFHLAAIVLLLWIGASLRRGAEILREINDHLADWPGGPVDITGFAGPLPRPVLRLTGGAGSLISSLWPSSTSSQRRTRV
jgi:hypothetical protein